MGTKIIPIAALAQEFCLTNQGKNNILIDAHRILCDFSPAKLAKEPIQLTTAKKGDLVFVHYTGKFDSGEVFDTSADGTPLHFILGEGDIIEGFDKAVTGMAIGEKKTVKIAPEQGYGEYSEDRVISTDRKNFGEDFTPEVDQQLALQMENGERAIATIVDFDDDTVTLDMNHPLAGENLHFELELVDIKDASEMPQSCGSGCSSCSGCGH
jgi:peptidylprolyl isomerase